MILPLSYAIQASAQKCCAHDAARLTDGGGRDAPVASGEKQPENFALAHAGRMFTYSLGDWRGGFLNGFERACRCCMVPVMSEMYGEARLYETGDM